MTRVVRLVLPIALLGLLFAKPSAQETTGEIYGKVVDAQGGGLQDVVVVAQGPRAGLFVTASTHRDGTFSIRALPSLYRVRFSVADVFKAVFADVVVKAGERAVANAVLQVLPTSDEGVTPYSKSGTPAVLIKTSLGGIVLLIDEAHAPVTSRNFLLYVDNGLYDGGRFHRVTRPDNYTPLLPERPMMEIIQGGMDPAEPFKGFPEVPLERTSVTGLKHIAGTVSMARGAPDSATSEFFILLDDQPSLDFGGKRFPDGQGGAAFGSVIAGLDVVRKIQQQPSQGQSLTTPVKIISIARVK